MIKFEVLTHLGFTVRISENYWQRLLEKHPDLENRLELIQETLINPDEIRRSRHDQQVFLFYLMLKKKRWMTVVTRQLNGDGFLITAYQTDAIKEGEQVWQK